MVRPIDTANLLDQLEALAGPKKSIMSSSALDRLKYLDFSSLNKSLDYGDVHVPRLVGDDMKDDDERKDHEEGEDDDIGKASDSDFVLQALKDETGGIEAYKQALEAATDPKLKEILQAIIEDETKHNAALESWLKEADPAALEGHEGEETPDQEAAEDDEAAEGVEEKDEPGSKEDLIAEIEAVLAEHDSGNSDEDLGKGDDEESKPDEDDEEGDTEKEDGVDKCNVHKFMPIVKIDNDQHKAYCIVAEPGVFDLQGDRTSAEEIEKAAHRFMERLQKTCSKGVGLNHEKPIDAYVIENVITQQPGIKLGKQILKAGTWYQGHKIEDEKVWKMIKSGEITGLSRQGEGVRTPLGKGIIGTARISKSGMIHKAERYELSDEDIDRVDWVNKGANGAKIAILKFTKPKGSTMMNDHKPAGAKARAGEAQVITKADIEDILSRAVEKRIEPLKAENVSLKKALQTEKGIRLLAEQTEIAKSDYSEIGKPADIAKKLIAIDASNMPDDVKKGLKETLRQANAMKREAGKLLYAEYGSSRAPPAPESALAKVNEMAQSLVDKSDKPLDISIARTRVYKAHPELREAVKAEERAAREARAGVV